MCAALRARPLDGTAVQVMITGIAATPHHEHQQELGSKGNCSASDTLSTCVVWCKQRLPAHTILARCCSNILALGDILALCNRAQEGCAGEVAA